MEKGKTSEQLYKEHMEKCEKSYLILREALEYQGNTISEILSKKLPKDLRIEYENKFKKVVELYKILSI